MRRSLLVLVALAVLILGVSATLSAAPFYQGKVLRVTVGFSAGGGFDLWARVVARHIGKHIPGNPNVIVENITGAGGLIQTNQLYSGTKPDGLTLGHLNGGLFIVQMFGMPGYNFDPNKFIYIGAANKENSVLVFGKRSGFTSVDKWRNSPVPAKLGGLVPGNNMDNTSRIIKDVLGFPTQLVTGYKGTADVMIAMDTGELAGGDVSWDSVKTSRRSQLASGESIVLMQAVAKPLKDLPNVPRVIDFAKTEEQKRFIEIVIHLENEFSRAFVVTPGTPKDRVEILRKAFQETTKDPELIAEVNKMGLTLESTSAEDLTSSVAKISGVDDATKAKLKDILLK